MTTFRSAEELISEGETGLFLFTNGKFLTINTDKTGTSGLWRINPKKKIDRVVIYRWRFLNGERCVDLFSAVQSGFDVADGGLYTIRLVNIELAGNTFCSWEEFVSTEKNPVHSTNLQYISRTGRA